MAESYSIVCIYCIFIHSSLGGHVGCFHVLAVVNRAAMNFGVNVSFGITVFPRYMPSAFPRTSRFCNSQQPESQQILVWLQTFNLYLVQSPSLLAMARWPGPEMGGDMVLCSSSFLSTLGVASLREQEGWGGAGQPHALAGHGAPWLRPVLSQHCPCRPPSDSLGPC